MSCTSLSTYQQKNRGFTLIEVLVALVIFAVISALSYRSLDALLHTRQRINAESERWREVMIFFSRFEQDVHRHTDRGIRNSNNTFEPAWLALPSYHGSNQAQLAFTILGNPEQPGTLMDSRRMGYRLVGEELQQLIWPALDAAPGSQPIVYTVMHNVKNLQLRYLYSPLQPNGQISPANTSYQWTDRWPIQGSSEGGPAGNIPRAVEINITLNTGESMHRLINLR